LGPLGSLGLISAESPRARRPVTAPLRPVIAPLPFEKRLVLPVGPDRLLAVADLAFGSKLCLPSKVVLGPGLGRGRGEWERGGG
jgi:hypothetical protein